MYQLIAREERYRELAQELSFKALMYDNNLSEAYRAMGLSYFLWGKLNEATASCTKAIEIDPDDFIAHWTLGRIYFTEGKLEQALELFRGSPRSSRASMRGTWTLRRPARVSGGMRKRMSSIAACSRSCRTTCCRIPDDARARLIYASKLGSAGRREEAIREGTKALVLSPGDPVMLYNAACMYVSLGEIGARHRRAAPGRRRGLHELRLDAERLRISSRCARTRSSSH